MEIDVNIMGRHRHRGRKPKIKEKMKRLSFFHIIWHLIVALAISLLVFLPIAIALSAAYSNPEEQLANFWAPSSMIALVTIMSLTLIGWPYFRIVLQDVASLEELGLKWPKAAKGVMYTGLGIMLGIGLALLAVASTKYVSPGSNAGLLVSKINNESDLAMMLVAVAIIAPIGEEFFFRGVAFRGFKKWLKLNDPTTGYIPPLVFSSVLFAVAHMYDVLGFFIILLLGISLAWVTQKSGSLLPPMVLHGAYNASVLFAIYGGLTK